MNTYHVMLTIETDAEVDAVKSALVQDVADARENYPDARIIIERIGV